MRAKTFPFAVPYDVPLYLAPMAGVSESPFRRLCHAHGADVVVTEFLSAEGIRRENPATVSKLRFSPDERPIGVQIFGADPQAMADAAAMVTDLFDPDFVDINFGCPVKKVVRRNGGSGCLKDLDLVESIIRAVSRATTKPVTCKIRSGWSEEMRDPVGIALRCQDAGAGGGGGDTGLANWDEIAAVAAALDIPVLGNGDIKTPQDALRMYEHTRCDGVMVGRGSYGQPWMFNQTRALLNGTPVPETPSVREKFAVALSHAAMVQGYEVDAVGAALEFRKHLGWYVKGLPGSADLRKQLHQVRDFTEVEGIFAGYLENYEAIRRSAAEAEELDVSSLTCEAA
jgi:tRNA-dihydrouridine synthase B